MVIERTYLKNLLKSRIEEQRHFIQVIAGPRQVGKTTLVKQIVRELDIPYSIYTADDQTTDSWLKQVWQRERIELNLKGEKERLLIIDEIQKIKNWSEVVKKEWDDDTWNDVNIKLLLLGSSRLLIMSGLTESLAGRFEMIRMTHWTYKEMKEAFGWNINQYIYFGGYPGAAGLINQESRWRAYVKKSIAEPSITKDVLETSKVYKPALLRQLFELGCAYSSQLLSYTKILGQLQDAGNVTTLSDYMQLLKEAGLIAGIQKFANDDARKRNSIPKLQVFNNALYNAFLSTTFNKSQLNPQAWGRQVESAVGAYLLSQADLYDMSVWYWREGDDEVDFILESNREIVAIEVKSNNDRITRGMVAFQDKFHPKQTIVVGQEGISLDFFLQLDLRRLFNI